MRHAETDAEEYFLDCDIGTYVWSAISFPATYQST